MLVERLVPQQNDSGELLGPSTDPLVRIDLNQLKCLSITRGADDSTRVGKLTGWAHGIEVLKVRDVLYLPDYGIPVCNGFVPEEAINYSGHLDVRLGRKPGEALPTASDRVVYPATFDRSSEEVCILGNIYSKNFGHWAEELLKVIALETFGFDGPYVIPEGYPGFSHESLALLGIPPKRVISVSRPIIYKAAFFTTTISHFTTHKFPGIVLRLRDRLYEAADFEAGVGDRIWVERGRNTHKGRDVVNKEEVYSCIQKYGFVSVDFSEYTLRKQIAIDRDMDVMLGPHGSAFVHCGFMATRREVIEIFSPYYINPSVIQLCLAMKHQYTQIVPVHAWFSPYKFGMDIMVDIDHLELALSSLRPRRNKWFGFWTPQKVRS
jgi:hypothetical protein